MDNFYIPFNVKQEDIKKILKKKLGIFSLRPFSLKQKDIFTLGTHIYLPVDVVSFTVNGEVKIKANDILREWKEKGDNYKEVNSYDIKYRVSLKYDNVLVLKNTILTNDVFSSIEPFNLNEVSNSNLFNEAKVLEEDITNYDSIGKDIVRDALVKVVKKDSHQEKKLDTHNLVFQAMLSKKVFIPIWLYNYKYKDKDYQIIINGQTGKASLEVPKSILKLIFLIVIIFLLILVLFTTIAYFL